jgi:hypothetical protein
MGESRSRLRRSEDCPALGLPRQRRCGAPPPDTDLAKPGDTPDRVPHAAAAFGCVCRLRHRTDAHKFVFCGPRVQVRDWRRVTFPARQNGTGKFSIGDDRVTCTEEERQCAMLQF